MTDTSTKTIRPGHDRVKFGLAPGPVRVFEALPWTLRWEEGGAAVEAGITRTLAVDNQLSTACETSSSRHPCG